MPSFRAAAVKLPRSAASAKVSRFGSSLDVISAFELGGILFLCQRCVLRVQELHEFREKMPIMAPFYFAHCDKCGRSTKHWHDWNEDQTEFWGVCDECESIH